MDQLQAVREVLRALAEVRNGAFYKLWLDLQELVKTPLPKIEFLIRRIADSKDAVTIVPVSLRRPDCVEVLWSLSEETIGEALIVTGSVELTMDEDTVEIFTNSHTLHDGADVVDTIHTLAGEVCGERSWATRSWL
jgi:hypothetical protein